MFANFAAQVKGLRGADAQVRSLKDVGNYDVWTTLILQSAATGEQTGFSYGVGGMVPGTNVNSTKLETNLRVPHQFVDESMNVKGIAIQIERATPAAFQAAGAPGTAYTATLDDFREIECHTLFRMHIGGDKPFAEGLVTWFAEGGGIYGNSNANNAEVLSNNVPTYAAVRQWGYPLPIGRIEKFWAELSWPRGAITIDNFPETSTAGRIGIKIRMLGVRARAVQ